VLKISPGHDHNDYHIARKLGLPILNVMNKDGTLNDVAGIYRYVFFSPNSGEENHSFLICDSFASSHFFSVQFLLYIHVTSFTKTLNFGYSDSYMLHCLRTIYASLS
jgi:hypothetical protein